MLSIKAQATAGRELEAEVNEAIEVFDRWYSNVQAITDPDDGARVAVGLVPFERAAIKTFLGFYLGVGGHYKPAKEEDAKTTNS